MKGKEDIILATNSNGTEITLGLVNNWILQSNKDELANFIFDRLYGRYIKPFEFHDKDYKKEYKNGFAIITSCCLLIETYVSFMRPEFMNTSGKSERCFGWFFNEFDLFEEFSNGGLSIDEYLDINRKINNKGFPRDFYINVRCGILHNGETRNGWIIRREGILFDENSKTVNAVQFLSNLKTLLIEYKQRLIDSDLNAAIWAAYVNRLKDIINKS